MAGYADAALALGRKLRLLMEPTLQQLGVVFSRESETCDSSVVGTTLRLLSFKSGTTPLELPWNPTGQQLAEHARPMVTLQ